MHNLEQDTDVPWGTRQPPTCTGQVVRGMTRAASFPSGWVVFSSMFLLTVEWRPFDCFGSGVTD